MRDVDGKNKTVGIHGPHGRVLDVFSLQEFGRKLRAKYGRTAESFVVKGKGGE